MKRLMCLILAVLTCFGAPLLLASCDEQFGGGTHTHSYGEWETVLQASCDIAGIRMRRCSCGYFETQEIESTGTHVYGEWKTVLEAGCGTKGARVRSCKCGEVESGEIPATGEHSFDADGVCTVCGTRQDNAHTHTFDVWQTVLEATCNAKGLRTSKCSCGESKTEEIPATGDHTFGDWGVLVAATCNKMGIEARICPCGYYEKRSLPESNTHIYQNGSCTVCGKPSKTVVETDVRVDSNGVRWAEDEWGVWREYDNLPSDLDYDDVISFLYWTGSSTVRPEFAQSEDVDDARLSSIYKRNQAIQDRLGVELNLIPEPGDAASRDNFVARVQRSKDAGTHDFDLIGCYAPNAGSLLMAGLSQNLSAIENSYLEMSKPWWPANLAHNMKIGDNFYFLSGDCSTNAIDQMHCIIFNKDLVNEKYEMDAEEYFATNDHTRTPVSGDGGGATATNWIYEMVYAGTWTLDDFIYLASDTYVDHIGDGVSVDDTFGLCAANYTITALYGGCGLRGIEPTTDGSVLKISDDWTSTRTVRLVAKLYTLFGSPSFATTERLGGLTYNTPFYNGTGYFSLHYLRTIEGNLVNNDKVENYGVLPVPKYDTNQKNYYTVIGNEFSMYSIFSDFDKRGDEQATLSMLSAVLECWGSEAYRKTTPVIFELGLKLRSCPTPCEADMCEIIRASIEFDLARVLRAQLSGTVGGIFSMDGQVATAAMNGTPWVSQYSQYLTMIETNLADFVKYLKKTW